MSKKNKTISIESVPGQGQQTPISAELFREIKSGLDGVRTDSVTDIWSRRENSDRIRYCIWANQHPDGRKHDIEGGKKAFPFDQASDSRVRTADLLIRCVVAMLKLAARRGTVRLSGVEISDNPTAGHLQTWLGKILNDQLGHEWRFELERWINWTHGDSPALSLLHVCWEREMRVRMTEFGLTDFVEYLLEQGLPLDEDLLDNLESLIQDPEREPELISALLQRFPTLKEKTLKSSLLDLRQQGRAFFPEPYVHANRPRIEALRMWHDVFIPTATRHPDRCRAVYKRAWYSATEVDAKETSGEWTPDFCAALRKQKGKTFVPDAVSGSYTSTDDFRRAQDRNETKDLHEVFHAYLRASTDDGLTGIFVLPFSYHVDVPAAPMRLLDYPHGELPFAWYVREVTTERLLDARGIAELTVTDQAFLKLFRDLSSDHAQLAALPPWFTDSLITERQLQWKPLGIIRKRRQETYVPAQLPPLPQNTLEMQDRIKAEVAAYFGLPIAEIPAMLQQILTQDMVEDYLDALRQVIKQILQLSIEYATPEEIIRVTGAKDLDIEALRATVQSLPDINISFASESFNLEYVQTVGEIIRDILLAIDTDQTIIRAEAVDYLCRLLPPTLADKILRSVQAANRIEEEDEEVNFAKIAAGIEPPMAEEGQDFATRLATLQRIIEANPEAAASLSPTSQQILTARVEHLQNQVQQQENARTGRQMGQQVLQ